MPSKKEKVASYLDVDEIDALEELCKKNNYSKSQGVIHLIRNYLIENDNIHDERVDDGVHKGDFNTLLDGITISQNQNLVTTVKLEKLEELLSELQCKLEKLETKVEKVPPRYLTDDEIASVTGRRLQEVYEWRLGIRKPRGKRVLAGLRPYVIIGGQWRLRDEITDFGSVLEKVVDFAKT